MLFRVDPEVAKAIEGELKRQQNNLEMIASENFTSRAVLEAMGTVLTNKYAEGYPGRRYYGGNKFIDIVENLAIKRAKKLFKGEHCNVQPNSGSPANMAAYFALLNVGDKIMGLDLAHGGHLTHGSPVNFSGILYKPVFYCVERDTGRIDYEKVRKKALEEKPNLILSGYTAYPREIDFKAFSEICEEVGAYFMADIAHIAGLIASGIHPSPVSFADVVTTTTHKTLRGPRGAIILCKKEHAVKIDRAVFPGLQGGPLEHVIAAKAVCFKEALTEEFKIYQRQIVKNSRALAEGLLEEGFDLVSGGTDNHLVLVDLKNKGVTGKKAQEILEEVDITVNKNMVPYDERSPFITSGIRIGTPALTTRGMREDEMKHIASLISKVLNNPKDEGVKKWVRGEVRELCKRFPLYHDLVVK
ncbi:MAG: serine hydroxymethyltransferase [Candidatus Methanofastidiosia archaeon]